MPATGTQSATSGLDFTAIKTYLQTTSSDAASSGMVAPKTYCIRRVRQWGMEPGYCEVAVQLKDLDTNVPVVAGVQDSPVYSMKQNDFAQVVSDAGNLFSGVITKIKSDISKNSGY